MNGKPSESSFLSPAECGVKVGVHERTIIRLLGAGVLKGCRIGKQWRIAEADLLEYIAGRTNARSAAA
jgi:excisionase family DNA binding protein